MTLKIRQILVRGIKRFKRLGARNPKSAFSHNSLKNVEKLNSEYRHWCNSCHEDAKFINNVYAQIVRLCEIDKADNVADFGCGTGVLVNKLKKDFPKLEIVGLDFSEEKIQKCKEHYGYGDDVFKVGSIYTPMEDQYDVIVATEVLEHLDYPKAAVRNMLSSLRSEGRLLFTVPDGRMDSFGGHIHFWSPESWQLFMTESVGVDGEFSVGKIANKNYAIIKTLK